MFKFIKIIEKEDCDNVNKEIHSLKEYFLKASNSGMTTLGAASYLHAETYEEENKDINFNSLIGSDTDFRSEEQFISEENEEYYPLHLIGYDQKESVQDNDSDAYIDEKITYSSNFVERYYDKLKRITNPILMQRFSSLYKKICQQVEKELNEKCLINEDADLAFPGFNIFTPYEDCEKIDSPPHIDLQWTYHLDNLKQIFSDVSEDRFLTFTLAIKLPKSGGGLYIWDAEDEKISNYISAKRYYKNTMMKCKNIFKDQQKVTKEFFEKETNPKFINYKEGYMTLFDNLLLHQVAPFNLPYENNEERITLQGHGIKCDNIWRLFF
jgi:hypothetical protein